MGMKTLFLFILLSVVSYTAIATDNDDICRLSVKKGLAGENVYKIFKDRNGMMWFGTSNGINMYNGAELKTYKVAKDRQYNDVIDIAQTADGQLYFSTIHGVYKINFTTDKVERAVKDVNGFTSALQADGNTLFIGSEKGLYLYDGKRTRHIFVNRDNLSDRNIVKDIFIDNKRRVWLISDYDLYLYDRRKISLLKVGIEGQMSFIGKLHTITAFNDIVYIGTTNSGIITYNVKTRLLRKYTDVGCNVINSLSTDGKYLYVATDGNGAQVISLKNNGIVKSYSTSSSPRLGDNSIYDFIHDKCGVDWFGLYKLGIEYTYYNKRLFNVYHFGKFDTSGLIVRSFCINGSQKIIGTRNGLYFVDEARNIVKYFSRKQLGGGIVTSICYYNNHYYISTYDGGVSVIDSNGENIGRMTTTPELYNGSFGKSVVSPDNKLWLGSNLGLFIYDSKTDHIVKYDKKNSQLFDGFISDLMFDSKSRCWICTKNGICLFSSFISSSSFPTGFINDARGQKCILGKNGDIVFYSEDGLFISNSNMTKFGKINLLEKIGSEDVDYVVYDRKNGYWINTDRGLFLFDEKFRNFKYYGADYNLDNVLVSSVSGMIDHQGRLWMGSTEGLIYADVTNTNKISGMAFDVIPLDPRVNDHKLSPEDNNILLKERKINISWNVVSKNLTFMPLLLNYGKPGGRFFEYRVDADQWKMVSESQPVSCKFYGFGRHRLSIRLAHSRHITEYTVNIYPSMLAIVELLLLVSLLIISWMIVTKRMSVDVKMKSKENIQEETHLLEMLKDYMEKEKPYLNQSLKLSDLSLALNCSTFMLSQVLKKREHTSYYDFINRYRIEEFKRFMKIHPEDHDKVTEVAEQCGFRRSSFFATFKKIEGLTPADYLRKKGKS